MTLPPVIERGVPIPKRRLVPRSILTRSMLRLEAGESFLAPIGTHVPAVRNACNSVRQASKRRGARIALAYRTLDDGRIRVWRTL